MQKQLEELRQTITAYQGKVKLCQENAVKVAKEADVQKTYELVERAGDRKYMQTQLDSNANDVLREKKAYVFA